MTINIAFVGTCQALSLCYYLQQCLLNNSNYNVRWVCYDKSFLVHMGKWSDKCKNHILDEMEGIKYIKSCSYIIYHPIQENKSKYFNSTNLMQLKDLKCKMFSLQRVHIDYYNDKSHYNLYLSSIQEIKKREKLNNIDILVSSIFENNTLNLLLLITPNHPTTYVFLKILEQICQLVSVPYLSNDQFVCFMKNTNYMELP